MHVLSRKPRLLFAILVAMMVGTTLAGCRGGLLSNPFSSVPSQWEPKIVEGQLQE